MADVTITETDYDPIGEELAVSVLLENPAPNIAGFEIQVAITGSNGFTRGETYEEVLGAEDTSLVDFTFDLGGYTGNDVTVTANVLEPFIGAPFEVVPTIGEPPQLSVNSALIEATADSTLETLTVDLTVGAPLGAPDNIPYLAQTGLIQTDGSAIPDQDAATTARVDGGGARDMAFVFDVSGASGTVTVNFDVIVSAVAESAFDSLDPDNPDPDDIRFVDQENVNLTVDLPTDDSGSGTEPPADDPASDFDPTAVSVSCALFNTQVEVGGTTTVEVTLENANDTPATVTAEALVGGEPAETFTTSVGVTESQAVEVTIDGDPGEEVPIGARIVGEPQPL